ncbi:hypothetical protein DEU56DRAFT_831354 [Suillus clintonianus]|uniref:uncharacterized protein n=1 Tax=Suillus clintonianus TaxID=1904413 RepID=UPI001B88276B|nr:uncharacterized protein DEU56DRAFT_831354 [Suillus clintonianus]KAG2122789.1 hypothetical protein DEU56DRAFT_831354 [Suillus clintonianus]
MIPLFDQADISIGITLQHTNYAIFAIACLWVYELALTLDKEVAFILDAPWRIPKLIYLTCRYFPFAIIVIDILRIIQPGLSIKSCTTFSDFSTYAGGIVLCCAESLFLRRVCATMGHRWIVSCCNVVFLLVPVVVTLTLYNSSSTVLQSPIPKVASCYSSEQGHIISLAYGLLIVVEIEIIGFMLYHSWKLYREYGNTMPLVRVLVRHNIVYFACGLLLSTTVMVIMLTLPAPYGEAASSLQFVMHEVLATRMHRELYNTAHHTEMTSAGNVSLPLVFAPAPSETQPDCRGPSSMSP